MNQNQPSRRGLLGGFFALLIGFLFAKRTPAATPAPLPPLAPASLRLPSLTPTVPDVTTFVYDADDERQPAWPGLTPPAWSPRLPTMAESE